MKTKITIVLLIIAQILLAQDQEIKIIKKGDFPEGIYMTLEDVLNKKPSSTEEVRFIRAVKEDSISDMPEKAFFVFKEKNKMVRLPLGVSHKGEMYFQTYRKYTNKKDKGYDPDTYSRFCKVTNYGRFIYFEEDIRGIWSKGLLVNLAPYTFNSIKGNTRGFLLDLENKEFNILRDCKDLNDFLTEKKLSLVDCESKKLSILKLREIIDQINLKYR